MVYSRRAFRRSEYRPLRNVFVRAASPRNRRSSGSATVLSSIMVSPLVGEFARSVLLLTFIIFVFTACLIVLAVGRRRYREKRFRQLDSARADFQPHFGAAQWNLR